MNEITSWFIGLATIDGFLYFLTGVAATYAYHCIRAKLRHAEVKIPWHITGIVVGIAAIVIVSFQSSVAYNTAEDTAAEVQQCQKEFNQALKDRSRITSENDELSQEQRKIVFDWIHALIFPPAPFDQMDPNEPARQKYGIELTMDTAAVFQKSLNRQDQLQRERSEKPLPDPTCGK